MMLKVRAKETSFFKGWPQTIAIIHDKTTGERYAVDSWFYDNGSPATMVPFDVWKDGYVF
jgi:hypothetical protein